MPALDEVFVVLENDFDESSVISAHNRGVLVDSSAVWPVGNASHPENSSYFEKVCHLQRSVCWNK